MLEYVAPAQSPQNVLSTVIAWFLKNDVGQLDPEVTKRYQKESRWREEKRKEEEREVPKGKFDAGVPQLSGLGLLLEISEGIAFLGKNQIYKNKNKY